jgi:hypothetical protein
MNNGVRGLVALAMLLTAKKLKDKKEEENKKTSATPDQSCTDVQNK